MRLLLCLLLCVPMSMRRQGEWVQRSQPVLVADQPWEEGVVQEPSVVYEHGYKMWYTGGWNHAAIGYATSRDGMHWQKHGIVLGMGHVIPESVAHSSILRHGLYYLFFVKNTTDSALYRVASPDGIHFSQVTTMMNAPWGSGLANSDVWVEGRRWYMLFECRTGATWQIGLATSRDGRRWHAGKPLTTLEEGTGTYGGPDLVKRGETYTLWYHASISGTLPTEIYAATSTDLIQWHRATTPALPRSLPWEVDQTADPSQVGNHLYFDGMDNATPAGSIGVATR